MTAAGAALTHTRGAVAAALDDARRALRPAHALVVAGVVAALVVLPALPLGLDAADLAADLYLAAAAVGLGMAVGIAGMPVLAQGAFLALGAYTAALLGSRAGWPTEAAVAAGGVAAAATGLVIGAATAWARPAIVAVATWLFAWLIALGLVAFPRVSGGSQGIVVGDADLAGVSLGATAHYVVAAVLVIAAVAVFATVARRPVGLALSAARQHRPAAELLGLPVARLRVGAVAAGAAFAGVAGALAVQLAGVADAGSYGPLVSFELLVAVVLGGAISPVGGVVGVALLAGLARVTDTGGLEGLQLNRVQTLIAAVVVITALGATDRGLVPSLQERRRRPRPTASALDAPRAAPAAVRRATLSARGLARRYGGVVALDGLDLDVRGGSVHALIGPNGSGKTTALRLLAGIEPPDSGTVTLDGEPFPRSTPRERALGGIVATLQATAVFPELTALENAIAGAYLRSRHSGALRAVLATPKARADSRDTRERALRALDVAGLAAVADARAGELDGAAQRRLMIACALATEPRVLLLDEPAAGASRAEVDLLAQLVRDLRDAGLAILLVEHNLRLVRAAADTVTALGSGKVIASGPADEVLSNEDVRRAHLGRGPL